MKNIRFFFENFNFLVVKFSLYLNRRVFVMDVFSFFFKNWYVLYSLESLMSAHKVRDRERLRKNLPKMSLNICFL